MAFVPRIFNQIETIPLLGVEMLIFKLKTISQAGETHIPGGPIIGGSHSQIFKKYIPEGGDTLYFRRK